MRIAEGTKLGHYDIRSQLGEGGMGEVYLAYDPTLRREVALKVLRAELLTDKDRVRRFEHEAYAASSLNHPNILTIYSIGSEAGCQFMVTEFVVGETLRQCVRRGPMSVDRVLDIGIQVASALAAAHDAGLIHRDIKPDNIMVRPDHLVKVLDFGLAKLNKPNPVLDSELVTQSMPITMSGVVMGTARYMSPEQARGLQLDKQTDIWSLGVVLYEMAAGHDPFDAKTLSDIIVAVLTREPPALGQFVAQVPIELERILKKALRKNPEERYQHAREFEFDLKNLKRKLDFQIELERSTEQQ
jgi:serine/threonine protein kinase